MRYWYYILAFLMAISLTACATDPAFQQQQGQNVSGAYRYDPTKPTPPEPRVQSKTTVAQANTPVRQQTEVQKAISTPVTPTAAPAPTVAPRVVSAAPSAKTWLMMVMMVKQEHVPGLMSNPTKNDVYLMFIAEYPNQAICNENAAKAYNAQIPAGHAVYVLCAERRDAVQPSEQATPAPAAVQPRTGG